MEAIHKSIRQAIKDRLGYPYVRINLSKYLYGFTISVRTSSGRYWTHHFFTEIQPIDEIVEEVREMTDYMENEHKGK